MSLGKQVWANVSLLLPRLTHQPARNQTQRLPGGLFYTWQRNGGRRWGRKWTIIGAEDPVRKPRLTYWGVSWSTALESRRKAVQVPGALPSPEVPFWATLLQGCSCPHWLVLWENLEEETDVGGLAGCHPCTPPGAEAPKPTRSNTGPWLGGAAQ